MGRFLRAILSRSRLRMRYRSPWRVADQRREVEARGLVWDRDRWYLAARLWRADRVLSLEAGPSMHPVSETSM